jgi:hypothetical protein
MTIIRARTARARLCAAGGQEWPANCLVGLMSRVAWIGRLRLERPAGWTIALADTKLVHTVTPL